MNLIGIDLGGTNIKVGLVERDGRRIVVSASAKTHAPRAVELIAEDIAELCRRVAAEGGVDMADIGWIGVATPGIVKGDTVVGATNLGWKQAKLSHIMNIFLKLLHF